MTKDRFRFRAWDKKNKRLLYNIQESYDGGFWVLGRNCIIPWHAFIANKLEVLGNVHTNLELLEDK